MRKRRERVGRGRVAQALVKRLASMGWVINVGPVGAEGGNRRWKQFDDTTVCWEAWATHPEMSPVHPGLHLVSYDRMTDCARGCSVTKDDAFLAWVHADNPKPKATS